VSDDATQNANDYHARPICCEERGIVRGMLVLLGNNDKSRIGGWLSLKGRQGLTSGSQRSDHAAVAARPDPLYPDHGRTGQESDRH